jgi:AAA+ superfamily predicted ATPase
MFVNIHKGADTNSSLEELLDDLKQLLARRMESHFHGRGYDYPAFINSSFRQNIFPADTASVGEMLSKEEMIILLIALVPHVQPNFFESLISEFLPNGGDFTEFGGVKGVNHRGMLPTGETVLFLMAGNDFSKRLELQELFRESGTLYRQSLVWLETVRDGEPVMSGRLIVPQEWIDRILFNRSYEPRFGMDFPARKITTAMTWDDVVLHPRTQQQIEHISTWLEYHHLLKSDENLRRKVKPGYRVLLYGPPGTGKTLTAALLGKQFEKDVYRIDLSQIVSKFIGETEKNLENVFRRAESRDWILFFDEADALFGKRTNVQSSHDKYANQEVSYLLQRVEDYPGLLLLASNFKNNLDDAFIRRFHEVVHFPVPNAQERKLLWQKSLPSTLTLEDSVDLEEISSQYELTGASILSAVQYATLRAYAAESRNLSHTDIIEGIRREFMKEEKSI